MSLASLQQRFQTAVLRGEPDSGMSSELTGHFEIYAQGYRARLIEALRDNYPVLHRALGDDDFDALAMAYAAHYPSRFRSIRWFGDRLVEFARARPELLPHPALVDLARMDWALRTAFDAADDAPLGFDDLAAVPSEAWGELRFKLQPSVQVLLLEWRIEPIWRALNENPDAETEAPRHDDHGLLVWRSGLECHWRTLDAREREALRAIAAGESFAEVCESLAAEDDAEPVSTAARLLSQWLALGLFARPLSP